VTGDVVNTVSADDAPRRAMVLAAGRGRRMWPITETLPKPLIEIGGRSMLDRVIDFLEVLGIEQVVVNAHHLAPLVERHLAKRRSPSIRLSIEAEPLETGGGVANALPLLGGGPFFVVNGDVLWRDGPVPTLADLAAAWDGRRMDGLLLLHPVATAVGYAGQGDFLLAEDGRLVRRRPGDRAPLLFAGLQILHPRLFAEAPAGAFSLNVLYDRAIAAGRLFGVVHRGGWCHVGTPADIPAAEVFLFRPEKEVTSRTPVDDPAGAALPLARSPGSHPLPPGERRGLGRIEARVYSIAPGLPFVDALAAGLRSRLGEAPEDLASAQIFLPTRRACRALSLAFVRQADGRPLLLPKMTPLGDIDEDDLAFEDETFVGSGVEIPPAIPALRRQLLLARQVGRHLAPPPSPAQAAQLAAELARLFDQVHTERLDLDDLDELVPDELARHWQITLGFLRPLAAWWQATVAAEQCIDPADRRNRLLAAQAAAWRASPPSTPVIAAGSTGSMPATAELLAVIASLPRGAVVLPGLDTEADEAAWRAISVEPGDPDFPLAQSHPQFGLARLLRRLGIDRRDVRPWPAPGVVGTTPARAALASRALAPAPCAEMTHAGEGLPPMAAEGLSVVETGTPEEEARVIALIMRQTLERDDLTAALVTPDRTLARRVAAELQRWDIIIDDSGGQPLAQASPAVFLRLVARMAVEELAPAPLLAALKHPLAAGGQAPWRFRRGVRALERAALRGLRPAPGIAGLRRAVKGEDGTGHDIAAILDALEAALAPLARLLGAGAVSLSAILTAHVAAAEALAASDAERGPQRLWVGDAGEALASFLAELAQSVRDDLSIPAVEYPDLFDALLEGRAVRPPWGRHPRLAVWGPLESRLQRADVMILGGLNEETWPPKAHASPWMSRPMMQAFGLPLPERRIGLSAHDFCQAFSAAEVWLTRARRKEGAPTVPCRWLLRLRAVLRDSAWANDNARRERQLLHWQRLLDAPEAILPTPAPSPAPPLEARPRRLSVTQVETWIRDPYAIYARHILRLRPLQDIDMQPEAADFGTSVHAALSRFLADCSDDLPPDAYERLLGHGREALGELLERPLVRAFWWPRFERIARWFADNERARRCRIVASAGEVSGKLAIAGPAGYFELVAKADRIDRIADGTLAIVDYKTGEPPKPKEVLRGEAPQLPLEAAIAEAGGFEGFPPASVAALEYWRLRGDREDGERSIEGPAGLAEQARAGLSRLIAVFDDPRTPYAAVPRPHLAPRWGDYEHLARVKEWAAAEEGGE
jgi:ATP-dependent helicase/nuclease subunit B